KASNTLDALVATDGHPVVKHYLQGGGRTLGTAATGRHDWDEGWEYSYEGGSTRRRMATLGFALKPWQTMRVTQYSSIGRFEGQRFDPTTWKPHTPTTAYMEMREDDAFWAARRVMAFSDDLIRTAVQAGQFSDAAAEQHLAAVLIPLRDQIARACLPKLNPIVNPRLSANGSLTFENAAVEARVAEHAPAYHATWFQFDNATGQTRPLGATR